MTNDLTTSLRSYFGFESFRPGQVEAIQNLLDGKHTLVVMPTGAGKSLIYQLAALHLPGLTLVISPLIALMKDQVDSLARRDIPATFINSTLTASEQSQRLRILAQGGYRLVYLAPERLRSVAFQEAVRRQSLSLLAVDEAHCLSEWGHDFRPDYLHLADFRGKLGNPLTVALTATATPKVQDDIIRLLGMPDAWRIITGFNRPNLSFEVRCVTDLSAKLHILRDLFTGRPDKSAGDGSAKGGRIVYTGTRRDAEEVAEFLQQVVRVQAEHYHAGLEAEARTRLQEAFLIGSLPVIVATNAFGMGVDRPDVRQVVHYNLPGSLEAYYQEAGRAGRDGKPAEAVLLYSPKDRALQEWFIENSATTHDELRRLYEALPMQNPGEFWMSIEEFSRLTGLPEVKVRLGLDQLERSGAVTRLGDAGMRMLLRRGTWEERQIQANTVRVKEHQQYKKTQLGRMIVYAETNACRRRILLDHFGDQSPAEAPCCCDNCLARATRPVSTGDTAHLEKPQPVALTSGGDVSQLEQPQRVALILLDTVYRLKRHVGRNKLAQILKGSRAVDILKFHYDRNVYYRRLAVYSLGEIEGLIEQLVQQGYLKVVGGKYPVLKLTPQGEVALENKHAISLRLPRPVSDERFARKKAEQAAGGTVEYTAMLFSQGLSPEEIAKQRQLTQRTIYGHLAQLITTGKTSIEVVTPAAERQQIEEAIECVGSVDYLAPIKELLPEAISYGMIRCVVEGWKRNHPPTPHIDQKMLPDAEITRAILECVSALPGKLSRSGVAKLLVGSRSKRVEEYHTHPTFNRLSGRSRVEVIKKVDRLLACGRLAKDERSYLIIGGGPDVSCEDPVISFLSRTHPRMLPGPWFSGWALDFHSRFNGEAWSRSPVGELAYRLKYQGDLAALPPLVEQATALIGEHPELGQVDAIVAVPPSTPRPADPVSAFASALGERLGLAILPALVKSRQTSLQKEMHTLAQKRANVAGAFAVQGQVRGKRMLIVDDLFDSGTTLEEVTRQLLRAGAARVCVLTLTRTIHSDA